MTELLALNISSMISYEARYIEAMEYMVMTLEFTAKEREILEALQSADSWLDRSQVASAIGRKRLNPHDLGALEELLTKGQVKRDTRISGITEKYIYRIETSE